MAEEAEILVEVKKEKKKKKKVKSKKITKSYSKDSISILRTKLRNNIELTGMADNKANVLLSLNAIMLTFLVPFAIPYIDQIIETHIIFPLIILVSTCLTTVYLSVLVLKPGKFSGQEINIESFQISPFFFGNFDRLSRDQYMMYAERVLEDEKMVKAFLTNDFYYIGLRLLQKMKMIRKAFNIFIVGLIGSIVLTIILLLL